MKKFIIKILIYFFVLIIVMSITLLVFQLTDVFTDKTGPSDVVKISSLKTNKSIKKIYIGDSVADQLFGHNSLDSTGCVSMTLNAAMTVYGHYLLLDNFCKTNNKFVNSSTEVVLIVSLKGLATDLTRPTTYNYFIKPFYNTNFILKYNEPYVINKLSNYNFVNISQYPIVKYRPFLTENIDNLNSTRMLSEINIIGIKKIVKLCKIRNIKCSIYIMPLSDYWKSDIRILNSEFKNAGLISISNILGHLKLTPDKYFVSDHVHFKNEFEGREFLNGKNAILKKIN